MPRIGLAFLLLTAGCGTSRFDMPFDDGQEVHFIVSLKKRPLNPVVIRPLCAVGTYSVRARELTWSPTGPRGLEVASLRVPSGRYRVSIYDPETGIQGRTDVKAEHELWVVLDLDWKTRKSRFEVFEEDPHEEIGAWRPLIPVPD